MEDDLWPGSEPSSDSRSGSSPRASLNSTTSSESGKSDTASQSHKSIFSRHFALPSRHSSSSGEASAVTAANRKGPYGITTVHRPAKDSHSSAQIVFVHGLGGGSEHTWTKDGTHWPRDLLPQQEQLQLAGIHVFGYDSDFKKSSTLNIHDFSKSLLNSLLNNPVIRESQCPIILVGHSMGGLVMKKAYILAKSTAAYEGICNRIQAMIFIATPHTGSGLVPILDKVFRLTSGLKPYLEDLTRNSVTIQSINSDFPAQSAGLVLYSFYETSPLSLGGVRDVMVVPKTDAVLNYPNEQSALLYGDHRSVCKFSSAHDHNFTILWQAITACIEQLGSNLGVPDVEPTSTIDETSDDLDELLGISEAPADDLYRVKSEKLPGTCSWLTNDETYNAWSASETAGVLWVRGSPGSGKSFAAGHAIENFEKSPHRCCYYFFNYGDRGKSSFEGFLLSMAWQMATIHSNVRRRLIDICLKDTDLSRTGDHRTLNRKLWEQGIIQVSLKQPCYWVIDSFDECRAATDLGKFINRILEKTRGGVRILVTSRNAPEDYQLSFVSVRKRDIEISDTQEDIARYLDVHKQSIPGSSPQERDNMRHLILEKSNGCFLWAILVLRQLAKMISSHARLRALEEMPPGMDQLYARILTSMSQKEKGMSKTVLMWVSCAIRPLRTDELQFVLENVAMDELDDIDSIVSKYCHDLVYIDNSRVKMRHASARRFLLRHDINSDLPQDFTIREEEAHKTMAMACLEYLNGPEMKTRPKRKMVASAPTRSVFVDYACQAVHEHVNLTSALDTEVLSALATFLRTNVLSWIEHLASYGDLETVLRFAHVLKAFLRRKSKVDLLLGDDVVIIDSWAHDLIRLVSKFGHQLLMHPESIIQLIPPFCPLESAPFTQFARGNHAALSVLGLSATSWDDCLGTVVLSEPLRGSSFARERLHSLATSEAYFGVGTSTGRVVVFNEKTCQEERSLGHGSPVLQIHFATLSSLVATASKRLLRLWNTDTWECHWEVRLKSPSLAMTFVDDDKLLLVALKNNTLLALNLLDRVESITTWIDILDDPHREWYHGTSPQFASFNPDLGLLAIGYSCRSVLVFNYDVESYQVFHHKEGLSDYIDEQSNISLYAMAFSKLPDTSLLAVSYSTAELVLFDTESGTVQATVPSAYFSRLESSPDGRTLAGARMDGAIELYDFETLHKLYRIRPDEGAVSALNFTADSTRFLVIRAGGHHCRVWDPATLYRRDVGDDSVRTPSLGSGSQDGVYDQPEDETMMVSAIECDTQGDVYFVGKVDHSVSVYDARTGASLGVLFSHIGSVKTLTVVSEGTKRTLISSDSAGFLMVHRLQRSGRTWSAEELYRHRGPLTGIQQVLCDRKGTVVLVCSHTTATLLSLMSGEAIVTQTMGSDADKPRLWFQHPVDASILLLLDGYSIYHYTWSSLERMEPTIDGMKLQVEHNEELKPAAATPLFPQSPSAALAMTFRPVRRGGKAFIRCFSARSFDVATADASATPGYEATCDQIQLILGMFRDRLVFLHVNGWVCSVKANGMAGEGEGIMHHFAPPREWLQSNRDFPTHVSKAGDVLFAVKGEVAVVKRGLMKVAQIRAY